MEQYSERNPYADHLVEVNKHNPVLTTQDICNALGATVVPKGTYVTEDVANKIARFKLDVPIELQVSLANTVSPSELFDDMLKAQAGTIPVSDYPHVTKELVKQCGLINSYPLLSQKITVFYDRMPVRYSATQSAAVYALLIAMKLGLDDESLETVFTAAQMHDAGFLNIDPDMACIFEQLPDVEKRQMFKQQLSLGKEFIDKVPNLSDKVGRAVAEYRERKDGSGWPAGLLGDGYSLEGQIVGAAVMLHEAFQKKLKPRGYGSSQLLPLVQIESESFEQSLYNAVVEMLKQHAVGHERLVPIEFMPQLANYLAVLQRILVHWLELAQNNAVAMREVRDLPQTARSMSIVSALEELYRNSGLWEKDLRDWLREAAYHESQYDEVEVVALMFESVLDKLKNLQWSMRDAAKQLGSDWISRCEDLATLLYALPSNHFEAFDRYECFDIT